MIIMELSIPVNMNRYAILQSEVSANVNASKEQRRSAYQLPYLNGVVKETLRRGMANPTRLPRVVPARATSP